MSVCVRHRLLTSPTCVPVLLCVQGGVAGAVHQRADGLWRGRCVPSPCHVFAPPPSLSHPSCCRNASWALSNVAKAASTEGGSTVAAVQVRGGLCNTTSPSAVCSPPLVRPGRRCRALSTSRRRVRGWRRRRCVGVLAVHSVCVCPRCSPPPPWLVACSHASRGCAGRRGGHVRRGTAVAAGQGTW